MSIIKVKPLLVTTELLQAELNRRLCLGFDFDFGDERGCHHFDTSPNDMKRWSEEVSLYAQAVMNSCEPNRKIEIKSNSGTVAITAAEWWEIVKTAASWRQPLYLSYFEMKAMNPIPPDFELNARWSR